MMTKSDFIKSRISKMTLAQKVGQCLVLGHVGTICTPEILRRIREYFPAGIRGGLYWRQRDAHHDPGCTPPELAHRVQRTPRGTTFDCLPDLPVPHCTNAEYCEMLNRLKREALKNGLGLPLHLTFDHEGDQNADYYRGGMNQTPNALGLARLKDPRLVYNVFKAIGKQYAALGFSWTHSLVLDVNTNPMNPEINIRSFGQDADTVAEYAVQAMRGWRDAGIICTGKHFPGRGESVSDAHSGLPVINISRQQMEVHLAPYRRLIAEGVPAIMTAHTCYPQLEPADIPATLSKRILTGILKDELGFQGVITTDAMEMGGILARFELVEACVKALNAGADLLLLRDGGQIIPEVVPALVRAAEEGRIPIERIEDANRRVLGVKYDYGFFDKPPKGGIRDVKKAGDGINDPWVIKTITGASKRVVQVIRDEQKILPLKKGTKVLLIEQVHLQHLYTNTTQCHPSLMWMKMLKHSDKVGSVECNMTYPPEDQVRAKARVDEADVIVMTNYYGRRFLGGNEFTQKVHTWGKPVIVLTNSPYPFTVCPEYKTVICTYGCSNYCLEQAANIIYGVGSKASGRSKKSARKLPKKTGKK